MLLISLKAMNTCCILVNVIAMLQQVNGLLILQGRVVINDKDKF